jgi:CRP-like cAMP-binding protein
MVSREQQGRANADRGLSTLMWDMLTGGAAYKEVLIRAFHPGFMLCFLWSLFTSLISRSTAQSFEEKKLISPKTTNTKPGRQEEQEMELGALGKVYKNGEIIVSQGETGDCMYVVQDGLVEVVFESEEETVQLNVLGKDEFFGEMAIFNQELRTATVRALGPARILTVNHKNLLKCIHEDPSLAYRLMQVMSDRIDRLSEIVAELSTTTIE